MAKPHIEEIRKKLAEIENQLGVVRGKEIFEILLTKYNFDTVLDIGSGPGKHAKIFESFGKNVFTCDMSEHWKPTYLGNFLSICEQIPDGMFDCVWCCHTLEHQMNVGTFLTQIKRVLKEDGVLAITVPPMKHRIVPGHVSLWTGGLLLYNLVTVGFDCSKAIVRSPEKEKYIHSAVYHADSIYPYDVSVIVEKKDICWSKEKILEISSGGWIDAEVHDGVLHLSGKGLKNLKPFFPKEINWMQKGDASGGEGDLQFDGRVQNIG